jgi:multiple sugar transport system substrate-binding protein
MRRKMNLLSVLLIFVFSIGMFSGFTLKSVQRKSPINLVIWGGVPAENGPQKVVNEWNKQHSDIQVTYVRYVNDDAGNTKLDTSLMSGEQIDLYFTYTTANIAKRVDGGFAENLSKMGIDSFVDANIARSGVFKYKSQYYSIPTVKEPVAMMINKSLLDAANIKIPKNWTVSQYRDIAKKLTKTENGKTTYGTYPFYTTAPIDIARTILGNNYLYKNSGKESNYDNDAFKYNKLSYDLINTDKSALPYVDILSRKLKAYPQNVFLSGEVAMMPFSSWMLRYVKDKVNYPHNWVTTFAPIPVQDGVKADYNIGLYDNFLMINSKSTHKTEALSFLKFWTTYGSRFLIPGGKFPAWNRIGNDEILKIFFSDNSEKYFDKAALSKVILNSNTKYSYDDITVAAPEMQQIFNEEVDKLYLDQENYDQFLKALKIRSDDAIKKALK